MKQIDDVMKCHGHFLDTCAKDCLLTDMALVEVIEDLLKLSLRFATSPTVGALPQLRNLLDHKLIFRRRPQIMLYPDDENSASSIPNQKS